MKIEISDEKLDLLREKVRPYLKPKRYEHTLAVEREAGKLAEIYLPNDINRVRAAALLHDITKKLDLSDHLKICKKFDIMLGEFPEKEHKLFHSKTAPAIIKQDFAEFSDEEILLGVRWHTTGRSEMSVFEALVYLADYIEETRTFPDCIELREYFYALLSANDDKHEVLRLTMIKSFDMTIANLISEGGLIDSDTVSARNYFVCGNQCTN